MRVLFFSIFLILTTVCSAQEKSKSEKKILTFSAKIEYQLGYGNSTPDTYLYSAEVNEEAEGKKMSRLFLNLSLSDYWIGNYQVRLYSSDSFVPRYNLSEEEQDHQKTLSALAFFVGKATGIMPAVGISKYKYSLEYVVDDKKVLIFDELGNELNIGDTFDLSSDIVKYSLLWGKDARYDLSAKDFFGSFELSYYQTESKGTLEQKSSGYVPKSMNLLTEKFKAAGFTITGGYLTKPINNVFQYRLGCHAELAYGDIKILKVGYFSSLLFGRENSSLKGILTLQGNLLESSSFGPSMLEDNAYNALSMNQFSYDLLFGLSYSF